MATEAQNRSPSRGRLRPGNSLVAAAEHFRADLEQKRRPKNTIASYLFDLTVLAHQIPAKSINQITAIDITRFLGESNTAATRKRRLTSVRRFFRFLIDEAMVLSIDPTEDFFPNRVDLRIPEPLTAAEQRAMIHAAEADEPWSLTALLLMMHAGLTRAELLRLERGNIDRSDPAAVTIRVVTDDPRKVNQNRELPAGDALAAAYDAFLDARNPQGALFPYGFQAINGMVERVRKRAEINRPVTPRTLRDTFAVRRAVAGVGEADLLRELGLADDLRNRESVRRYLAFADAPGDAAASN